LFKISLINSLRCGTRDLGSNKVIFNILKIKAIVKEIIYNIYKSKIEIFLLGRMDNRFFDFRE